MERSEDRRNTYNRRSTVQVPLRLNTKTDADVIERLRTVGESRAGYIKRLIREDIANGTA